MKSILVTGGTGLVGNGLKVVSKDYIEKYNFIYISSKDFNLTCYDQTKAMFEKYRPNYVIHLAACVGGLYKNMNNKVIMLEKNLMINYNVVKCSHDYKVEKLISCLSTCIFPDKVTYPIDESFLHNGPPHHSNDAYAYSKRMLEIHCKAYRENYGSNFICVSPTNVYGPHDNFNLEDAHVLPALIHKCYLAKEANEDFIIRGTGVPLRQFIFSEDLAKLIMIIMENHNDDNLILSPPESDELSIKDLATFIAKEFNYEEKVRFDSSYSDGQYKKTVSVNKLLNVIGGFQYTKIEDGIKKSVRWFIQNKDSIKN
jgi:GDP-L-fucose synthase